MRHSILAVVVLLCALQSSAQLIAVVDMTGKNIPGICNANEVYALFSNFKGQKEAVPPITKEELLMRLNTELSFLKSNPKYNAKYVLVSMMINCKGEMVYCELHRKTKDEELNEQILAVFRSFKTWQPGTLNEKSVDSNVLESFKIKKGKVMFD